MKKISRRSFLETGLSGILGASLALDGSYVLSDENAKSETEKIEYLKIIERPVNRAVPWLYQYLLPKGMEDVEALKLEVEVGKREWESIKDNLSEKELYNFIKEGNLPIRNTTRVIINAYGVHKVKYDELVGGLFDQTKYFTTIKKHPLDDELKFTKKDKGLVDSFIKKVMEETKATEFPYDSRIVVTSGLGKSNMEVFIPSKESVKREFSPGEEFDALRKYMFCSMVNPDPMDRIDSTALITYYKKALDERKPNKPKKKLIIY
ncbi:MAG: hypothetical protein WC867_06550 [Candidatus Pacearchaeota archaeon]|jgi:hypothetical protein